MKIKKYLSILILFVILMCCVSSISAISDNTTENILFEMDSNSEFVSVNDDEKIIKRVGNNTEILKKFFFKFILELNTGFLNLKILNLSNPHNISFNIFPKMVLNNIKQFLSFNYDDGIMHIQIRDVFNSKSSFIEKYDNSVKFNDKIRSVGEDITNGGFNSGSSNVKSYEISKKNSAHINK